MPFPGCSCANDTYTLTQSESATVSDLILFYEFFESTGTGRLLAACEDTAVTAVLTVTVIIICGANVL